MTRINLPSCKLRELVRTPDYQHRATSCPVGWQGDSYGIKLTWKDCIVQKQLQSCFTWAVAQARQLQPQQHCWVTPRMEMCMWRSAMEGLMPFAGANEGMTVCREAQPRLLRRKIQERRAQWRTLPHELLFLFSNLPYHRFSLKCINVIIFKRTRNFYFSFSARYLTAPRGSDISWLQGLDRCLYTHTEQTLWF